MKVKKSAIFGLLIITTIIISGCTIDDPDDIVLHNYIELNDNGYTLEGVNEVVDANSEFAFDLYSNLNNNSEYDGKNIFFSPYSISTAMSMVYDGAVNETAQEIQDVFHFPENNNDRRPNIARVQNELNMGSGKYQLSTANALWSQEDFSFLDEYLNITSDYYYANNTNLNFATDTEESRQIINKWVEDQTNNKILDLMPQGSITSFTKLVLTNAIYFKGTWVYQFDPADTHDRDFMLSEDNIVSVPMMFLDNKDAKFNYIADEKLQMIELPYEGDDLLMLIILPKENLDSINYELSAEKIKEYQSAMRKESAIIKLPKFTFETKYSMKTILTQMGMPTPFTEDADFSAMADRGDELFIQAVIHQAFVDVNEEGTEAAAATGISIGIKSLPQIEIFNADHPFIFMIQHKGTGEILFFGRVVDPR